ncbi:DUF1501 domain-containing protein [Planctomyces sp. SH-PL62]|uniref:DUF1501 domain-containing protein n=1 Tax=Planctomyces sp. SH-PL62 TaxID=1636152 RepID=UPI00078D73CF|nr:DUF1501 domain-containing protein [Planctomyces sp. SH-PL62]AMV36610.1 hypothetical protein VT85_04200 [Planctomyces sp. SH-PL62]
MSHVPNRLQDGVSTRREMLCRSGVGFGSLALGALLSEAGGLGRAARAADAAAPIKGGVGVNPLLPRTAPAAAKAKRVVHLFMNGGMSHVDTFDPKPALARHHGKEVPSNLPTERKTGAALASPYKFRKYGESGLEISEIFERTAQMADELCVVRSMHADVPNHEPSLMLMNCGEARQARPSLGSWVLYGLGTENQNLPGFLVMCPGGYPIAESQNWQSAFLPGVYQGTYLDSNNTDIEKLIAHIRSHGVGPRTQRAQLDLLAELNREHLDRRRHEADLEARIQSFELAYRMQSEAADAFDVDREPEHVRALYGPGVHARQLLATRRLLERGVRFVQLWHGAGQPWDHHDDLETGHRELARQCDQPIAAFLFDLKQRGMLDDTLVVCTGEFGRTPTVELPTPGANAGKMNGRDHNHYGFTAWLAGGGVKKGHVHGATDELGFQAVEDKVHVHDLHATILHLLGFDHEKFTFHYAGRDFRLTDVHGRVVHEIIA